MRSALHLFVLILIFLSPPARADETPAHLEEAVRLVKRIQQSDNQYIFGGNDVTFPSPAKAGDQPAPADGACLMKADCSGFINALFGHCFKLDGPKLKAWLGQTRPNAVHYFNAIEKERGFERIVHIKDARGGDVMAMAYQRNYTGKATGHVMLIAGDAIQIEPVMPIIEGTTQWEVPVIDSAVTAHGPSDTRYKKGDDAKDATGIGQGKLRVYVDESGHCVGYTWGVHRILEKDFYPRSDRPIAMGRLKKDALRAWEFEEKSGKQQEQDDEGKP